MQAQQTQNSFPGPKSYRDFWARFSKVSIINGPGKLSPFTLKIKISIVVHLKW